MYNFLVSTFLADAEPALNSDGSKFVNPILISILIPFRALATLMFKS